MPFGWSVLARVARQKPPSSTIRQRESSSPLAPCGRPERPAVALASPVIVGSFPCRGTIVERRHWTIGQHPLGTRREDRLMMHPQSLTHRKELEGASGWVTGISRSLDPAGWLSSRACYRKREAPNPLLRIGNSIAPHRNPRHKLLNLVFQNQTRKGYGHLGKILI